MHGSDVGDRRLPPSGRVRSRSAQSGRPRAARFSNMTLLNELVTPLAQALGPDHEVVLHDLRKIPRSIVAIAGTLTGRSAGGPTTDLLLRHLKQHRSDDILRYRTQGPGGRTFRSSTIFIRDPHGKPYACLCINTDVTAWLQAQRLLGSFTSMTDWAPVAAEKAQDGNHDGHVPETFAMSVEDLTVQTVQGAIAEVGVAVELMQKEHKIEVVRQVEELGLFLIRDAVDYVAQSLGVTRYTIYKYLSELKVPVDAAPNQSRRATNRRLPLRASHP
jgi:predicted transcriptional regulator YheO